MFRIALVLFKSVLGRPELMSECPTLYETLERIRHIPPQFMHEEYLIREVCSRSCRILYNINVNTDIIMQFK